MKTQEFWATNGKTIFRLALAGTRIPSPPEIYPLSARVTLFLAIHIDTKGLFEKKPSPFRLEGLDGLSERSISLLQKITKTSFQNVMSALNGNTLRLIHSPIIAQTLLDKASTRFEMDAVVSKLSQAKFSKQLLVSLKGRGLKQLIAKRTFAVKEKPEKRRKIETNTPTTSKAPTPAPTPAQTSQGGTEAAPSKTEEDSML